MEDQRPAWRRRAVAALLVLLGTAAALPSLLSWGPLHGVTRALLAPRLGLPLGFDGVSLSWRGPTTFERLAVGGRGRFAADTLFAAETVSLDASFGALLLGDVPLDLVAEGAELRFTRDTAGAIDWAVSLGDDLRDRLLEERPAVRIELRRTTIRVEDRPRSTIAWLREADAVVDTRDPARWRVALAAQSETPAGRGALDASMERREDGSIGVECIGRGFELGWYTPLFATFIEGGELGGRLDLDLNLTLGPGARFDGTANGTVEEFRFLGPRWAGVQPIEETVLRTEGGIAADFDAGVFSLDRFHLSSSFAELKGNGLLELGDDGLTGDAVVHFNADAQRAVRKLRPLFVAYAPFRNIGGNVDVRLRPKEGAAPGRFDLAVTLEQFALQPSEERALPFGTSALFADVAWNPGAGTLSLRDLRTEARWADMSGRVELTWPAEGRPLALDTDVTIFSPTDELAKFVHVALPGVPLLMAGEVDAKVRARIDDQQRTAHVELGSQWFDVNVDHDRGGGRIDTYSFFGKPFEATLDLAVPVDADDPLEAATGRLVLDAENCSIYRNELEELALVAALRDGRVAIDRLDARGFDGKITSSGALVLAGDAPGLELELVGEGLRVNDRFPSWFAACVAPIFAARPGPFAVKSETRLTGRLSVAADGLLLKSWLDTLRGEGSASFSASEIDGSPVLQALTEPYGKPGPRDVLGIETVLAIERGEIRSNPVIRLADGTELRLTGAANGLGEMDYQVSAESIFGAALCAEHRILLRPGLFRIDGRFDRPNFLLPNPGAWKALAAEGRLDEELRKLQNP